MVNHLKVLLRAKELSGNLHFDTFFHIERNLSERGTTLPSWPPVHVSARDSTFLHQPLGCTAVLQREQL